MLRIQTTDDLWILRAHCVDCAFSVHRSSPSDGGYEQAVNHALNENHRVLLVTTNQTEMNIFCSPEEDTVNLGPKEKG